ncbi:hypothetical protein [Streptomyces sp. NPDC058678]|uniref:nSTAND1 domain-containing NTPase n=1 Tax=Streptomyces sp. NPDC058678 TaxID=3346595 RepID=UPI003650E40B
MGRPEKPLDPQAGPVQRLAHELRELRRTAGSPSYRTMAETAGFSATTLTQAAAGERLPSLAVVLGYARACGADPGEWEPRWKEARTEAEGATRDEDEGETPPPYRGLARFEQDDHALFFGRDRMIEDLNRLVCDHRFAVLFGASGSGKSSLLRAGLIPRLRQEIAAQDRPAVLRVLTPGPRPATTYGHLLAPAREEPESWVVVDQFEEVFTLCRDRAERARFIDLLLSSRGPDSRLRVLVAVRADFYARCSEHGGLAEALRGAGLLLGPMTADELRAAVVKPAQAVGHLVERELTARIVEDVLDEPGGLPMLSHALLETWRRRKGRMLTLAAYKAVGGVSGAIAASAEEVYGELSPARADAARRLLLRMVEPGQGTPDTRRPLLRTELEEWADPDVPDVVERLARARLLTTDEEGVHLAHEALITCWPRLHGWVEQERGRLRHHRALTEAARSWLEHDRDQGALYRGTRLARAEELFADGGLLTVSERAFLTAALDARDAERRAAARSTRRARMLVSALSGVLAVALAAALVAWQTQRDNDQRRTDAAARRIADVADALRTTDPRTAMLLGVAAWRVAPLSETRRALLGSLAQPERDTFTDPTPGSIPNRFVLDSGRTLLSIEGSTWRTWNMATHTLTGSGRLPDGNVQSASPGARVLAVSMEGDGVRLWNTAAGAWLPGAPLPPYSTVRFTGHTYLEGGPDDDRVRLHSLTDGKVLYETRAPSLETVAPSADGRLVAVCPSGGSPQVRDLADRRTLHGAWEKTDGLCDDYSSMLFFGSGTRLAALSDSGVRVWDTASGAGIADIADPGVSYAAFGKDDGFLATADATEIRVWRLTSPSAPVFRHALNNQYLYDGLAWDPARPVLRYLAGGTVHSVDVTQAVTPAWRARPVNDVRFSPNGSRMVTAQRDGTRYRFQLYDTRTGRVLRTLPPTPVPVSSDTTFPVVPSDTVPLMTFAPDGRTLAYGVSAPGSDAARQHFTLWDLTRDRARTTLNLTGSAVVSVALGPGGRTLYAARTPDTGDLTDEVWDTGTHRRTGVLKGMAGMHLAVHPDGRLLVGDNSTAALPSGKVAAHDLVQAEQTTAVAFSGDGALLVAGDQAGRVALWDGRLKNRAGLLRNVFPAPLRDTPEAVSELAVSSDGRTLAVGGDAGSVQLWDVRTQQPLGGPLTTPGEAVDSLAFSPDGTTLYVGSAHVPLQRYVVDPERAVREVCAREGAELTRAQWRTYVPEEPYRRICH